MVLYISVNSDYKVATDVITIDDDAMDNIERIEPEPVSVSELWHYYRGRSVHPDVNQLLNRVRIDQHTPNWYNERRLRITASIASAILGENPFENYNSVFLKKTGRGPARAESAATEHGHAKEHLARHLFEQATGLDVLPVDVGLVCHNSYNFLGASPDGVGAFEPFLIEIKCPFRRTIKHEVPMYYMAQMQLQMEVCNIDTCYFVQYCAPTVVSRGVLDIVTVKRDPEWMSKALPVFEKFWNDVKTFYEDIGQPIGTCVYDYTDNDDASSDSMGKAVDTSSSSSNRPRKRKEPPPGNEFDVFADIDVITELAKEYEDQLNTISSRFSSSSSSSTSSSRSASSSSSSSSVSMSMSEPVSSASLQSDASSSSSPVKSDASSSSSSDSNSSSSSSSSDST